MINEFLARNNVTRCATNARTLTNSQIKRAVRRDDFKCNMTRV